MHSTLQAFHYCPPEMSAHEGFTKEIWIHNRKNGAKTAEFITAVQAFYEPLDNERAKNLTQALLNYIADSDVDKNARLSLGTPILHIMALICPLDIVTAMLDHPETEVGEVRNGLNALTYLAKHHDPGRYRDVQDGGLITICVFRALIGDPRISILPQSSLTPGKMNWHGVLFFLSRENAVFGFVQELLCHRNRLVAQPHFALIEQGLKAAITAVSSAEELSVLDVELRDHFLREFGRRVSNHRDHSLGAMPSNSSEIDLIGRIDPKRFYAGRRFAHGGFEAEARASVTEVVAALWNDIARETTGKFRFNDVLHETIRTVGRHAALAELAKNQSHIRW